MLAAILGLDPDVPRGTLRLTPIGLTEGRLDGLTVHGLRIAGGRLSVRVSGTALEVLEAPAALTVDVRPA